MNFHFRESETEVLKEQIDKLNTAIQREEEKARDLEIKAKWVLAYKATVTWYIGSPIRRSK